MDLIGFYFISLNNENVLNYLKLKFFIIIMNFYFLK